MRLLLTLLLISACAEPAGEPVWALNWATVTPAEDGTASGVQVWQLYKEGWDKRYKEEFFSCSLAQELEAIPLDCPETGVPGCVAHYQLELDVFETDCPEALTSSEGFNGPRSIAIGALPESISDEAPYESDVLGWFILDGELQEHGYAYAEALESGEQPPPGWVPNERYVLWPAFAWKL